MKTEETIRERLRQVEYILKDSDLDLPYAKIQRLQLEKRWIRWILDENLKDPEVSRRIGISGDKSMEDKVYEYLQENPYKTTSQISLALGLNIQSVLHSIKRLVISDKVKGKGLGHKGSPKRYYIEGSSDEDVQP